ncbi:hypothetical protein JY651_28830 [Pyxidicoccus parkwayensis]|uniref:DnaA N-terminal domain-containing protein n=1 Tax=Pyxidicoccus parkwayensis TaxID=2813578 RepID=A0ABX7NKF5_9BACT|nr:hypothetical protein [Pyxidicoccus parkwaysis]QSQ19337.1 hypothetical protein JY651_28830 [Pyxidicoccus parkwaysis]
MEELLEALARAEARAQRAEELAHLQAQALAALAQAVTQAPPVGQVQRDARPGSVTSSVTQEEERKGEEEKAKRKREAARLRKQVQRLRDAQRDVAQTSVTPKPFSPPPPPPSASEKRGALAVVTVAARGVRDVQRDGLREHRTPATLPPDVRALREAWNELVAAHDFPAWGERTSKELLADALAALEARPLEEWRRIFSLVPRSPVCRGELKSRVRANVVRVLRGRTSDGYEVAEKLLSGAWSLDPEPEAAPSPEEPGAAMCLEGVPEGTEAARAWAQVLAALRSDGRRYVAEQLQHARPVAVEDGCVVVALRDRFARDWVEETCRALLDAYAAQLGHAGIRLAVPEDEEAST